MGRQPNSKFGDVGSSPTTPDKGIKNGGYNHYHVNYRGVAQSGEHTE